MRTSKRDYLEVVRLVRRLEKGTTKRLMWAHGLAAIFARSNPRFEKQRFVDACGADDEPGNVVDFAEKQLEK